MMSSCLFLSHPPHAHTRRVADVLCLTSLLAACSDPPGFRGLPVFLLGSSMGGNLALHAAMQQVGATCLRG